MMKGRMAQRLFLLLFLILLGVVLFYVGREHQVYLDNKTVEIDGMKFKALEQVNVVLNDETENEIELMKRDRDVAQAVGPSFKIRVDVLDSMGGDVERTVETQIHPGFTKDLMISIPLLLASRDDFVLPPPGLAPRVAEEEAPAAPSGETGVMPQNP